MIRRQPVRSRYRRVKREAVIKSHLSEFLRQQQFTKRITVPQIVEVTTEDDSLDSWLIPENFVDFVADGNSLLRFYAIIKALSSPDDEDVGGFLLSLHLYFGKDCTIYIINAYR